MGGFMEKSNLKIQIGCVAKRATRALNKLHFSLFMLSVDIRKSTKSNNKRRKEGKPMIRKRAHIKTFRNRKT